MRPACAAREHCGRSPRTARPRGPCRTSPTSSRPSLSGNAPRRRDGCGRPPRGSTRGCSRRACGWAAATTSNWSRTSCSATPGGTGSRAPSGPRGRGCAASRCPPTRPRATSRRRRRSFDDEADEPADDIEQIVAVHADAAARRRRAGRLRAAGRRRVRRGAGRRGDGARRAALVAPTSTTGCSPNCSARAPRGGLRPRRLQDLADRISAAFGPRAHVNPDSPAQILKAFAPAGLPIPSTRAHVLKRVDHPAVPLLLEYKELARLHAAHGWAWLDTWVQRRPVPPRVRRRRRRVRPLGDQRRRRAADPARPAPGRRRRPRLDAGRRRRRPARAPGAGGPRRRPGVRRGRRARRPLRGPVRRVRAGPGGPFGAAA